jgi:hypothetical protein
MALKNEVIEKIAALITAAFGLVAALAWNGAILAIFRELFPDDPEAIGPMVTYAVIVTIIAVIMTIMIARAASKAAPKEAEK